MVFYPTVILDTRGTTSKKVIIMAERKLLTSSCTCDHRCVHATFPVYEIAVNGSKHSTFKKPKPDFMEFTVSRFSNVFMSEDCVKSVKFRKKKNREEYFGCWYCRP